LNVPWRRSRDDVLRRRIRELVDRELDARRHGIRHRPCAVEAPPTTDEVSENSY
jgi:hypothetical protein